MNWKNILKLIGSTAAGAAAQIITTGIQSGASPTTGGFWGGVGINTGLVSLLALLAHLAPSPVSNVPTTPVREPVAVESPKE